MEQSKGILVILQTMQLDTRGINDFDFFVKDAKVCIKNGKTTVLCEVISSRQQEAP
jgi:hypothetical protein